MLSVLARIDSSLSQAVVAMHRPPSASTSTDSPTQPVIPCSIGSASSRA